MGRTYGVYVSEALDNVLLNELRVRQLKKDAIDSVPKLIGACVQRVVSERTLSFLALEKEKVKGVE